MTPGEIAYTAWLKSIGGVDDNSLPMPTWAELSDANRDRWEPAPKVKPWWKSRTLWANALVLALTAAESQLNVLQGALPGGVFPWVAFTLPVINAALRFITTSAISAGALK